MSLETLELPEPSRAPPRRVAEYLKAADACIEQFVRRARGSIPSFVPSDYVAAYHALAALAPRDDLHNHALCEWGSGFGVVAGLAAMLGFDAYGIEIESDLVDAAEEWLSEQGVSVQLAQGSFVPHELVELTDAAEGAWLNDAGDDAYSELEADPDDFGVIYAYPWPGNEELYELLFERSAAPGAFLVMHRGLDGTTVQRKPT